MKNLTVLNPIAFAIRHGEKRVINVPSRIRKTFKYKCLKAIRRRGCCLVRLKVRGPWSAET